MTMNYDKWVWDRSFWGLWPLFTFMWSILFRASEGILNTSQRRGFLKRSWWADSSSFKFSLLSQRTLEFFFPCLPVVKKKSTPTTSPPKVGLQEPSHEQLLIRCSWLPGWQVALMANFLPRFLVWENTSLGGLQQQCQVFDAPCRWDSWRNWLKQVKY